MNVAYSMHSGLPGAPIRERASEARSAESFLAERKGTPGRLITPAQVVSAVRQLPALPLAVARLLALFQGPEPEVAAVSDLIGRDQTLTARVLRLANSPWYGMSGRINSLQEAILVLGLSAVRNLALAASLTSAFPSLREGWFDTDAFWRHSLGSAVCARQLALLRPCAISADLAYCAGLLHDIGKIALATALPVEYAAVMQRQTEADMELHHAEYVVLGTDHAQVGAALAHHWHFSAVLEQGILGHHAPPEREGLGLADLLHAADLLAHALSLADQPDEAVDRPCEPAWRRLGIDWDKLRLVLPEIELQARHATAAFGPVREDNA